MTGSSYSDAENVFDDYWSKYIASPLIKYALDEADDVIQCRQMSSERLNLSRSLTAVESQPAVVPVHLHPQPHESTASNFHPFIRVASEPSSTGGFEQLMTFHSDGVGFRAELSPYVNGHITQQLYGNLSPKTLLQKKSSALGCLEDDTQKDPVGNFSHFTNEQTARLTGQNTLMTKNEQTCEELTSATCRWSSSITGFCSIDLKTTGLRLGLLQIVNVRFTSHNAAFFIHPSNHSSSQVSCVSKV